MLDKDDGADSRILALIEAWQQTGNVAKAMRRSGVKSRSTANYWLKRYQAEGE